MSTFKATTTKLHREKRLSERYRPYDLRHTALSAWLTSGLSVATVAQIAGNSPAVIWAHYAGADKAAVLPTL